jgi:hypothetical protein
MNYYTNSSLYLCFSDDVMDVTGLHFVRNFSLDVGRVPSPGECYSGDL